MGMLCGCVEGYSRCPRHAAEFAVSTMEARKWTVVPKNSGLISLLKEMEFPSLEWTVGWDNLKLKKITGIWAQDYAVWIAQTRLDLNTQKWFLNYIRTNEGAQPLLDAIRGAFRFGGIDAVGELIETQANELLAETWKALGRKP